jgi:hypothetical protein
MRLVLAVLLATLGASAHAAFTISIEPARPTPADTIVVTFRDSAPTCPTLRARAARFEWPNVFRFEHERIGDCGFAPFSEVRTTIGPLPAGAYVVGLSRDSSDIAPAPPPEVTLPFFVTFAGGDNADKPYERYAGHYLTAFPGEGVFIEQYGEKSFVTLVTYGSDGQPTWLVMSDARWTFNAARNRREFAGAVYRARRGEESPPSVTVAPVGTGAWYPAGFDGAVLEMTVDGTTVNRTLRRYRF